jgi:Ribosomal protein S26
MSRRNQYPKVLSLHLCISLIKWVGKDIKGYSLTKKRRNRGRAKGAKGHAELVQCDGCGGWVPRDKAIRVTRTVSPVDPQLERELAKKGTAILKTTVVKNYCVKCAVYMGLRSQRAREERKQREFY